MDKELITIALLVILALWSWCFYIRLGKMISAIRDNSTANDRPNMRGFLPMELNSGRIVRGSK